VGQALSRSPGGRRSAVAPLALAGVAVTAVAAVAAVALGPRVVDAVRGDRTVAPDAALDDQCGRVPDAARRTALVAQDGRKLGAALVGDDDARAAVVLRHGASQTICDWLPWADELAATGVRVLLFDRRGQGSSPGDPGLAHEPDDLASAVEGLRASGADRVVLVASSMGNSVTFAALERITSDVCAVVSVSPVLTSADSSGRVDGRTPAPLPPSLFTTWETGNPTIAANARRLATLADEQRSQVRELPVDTDDHSLALVRNHDEVRDFVTDAVSSCA